MCVCVAMAFSFKSEVPQYETKLSTCLAESNSLSVNIIVDRCNDNSFVLFS